MMLQDINIFEEMFLATDMWGLIGPIAIVMIGYLLIERDKYLGIFWMLVEAYFIASYYELFLSDPAYSWHITVLLFGVVFFCLFPLMFSKRKR